MKGNFRVYDMKDFLKIAKVPSIPKFSNEMGATMKSSISVMSLSSMIQETCFRLYPNICLDTLFDKMIIVQTRNEVDEPDEEKWKSGGAEPVEDKKKAKGEVEPEEEPKEEVKMNDFEVLLKNPPPKPEIVISEKCKSEGEGEGDDSKEPENKAEAEEKKEGEDEEVEKSEVKGPVVKSYEEEFAKPELLNHEDLLNDLDEDAFVLMSKSCLFVFDLSMIASLKATMLQKMASESTLPI